MRSNPTVQAVATVLDAHGIAYRLAHGGKHPRVVFLHAGRTHRLIVGNTGQEVTDLAAGES